MFHVFFGELAASFIDWQDSPFQAEVGYASLGFAAVGFLAFRGSWQVRLAAVGHVLDMIESANFAPGNAGVLFWTDLLLSAFGFALLAAARTCRRPRCDRAGGVSFCRLRRGHVQFGVGHLPTEDAGEVVRMAVLAEELGFDVFYVADSHIISREAYVLLGAIAGATRKIQIGPGVSPPQVRHPTLTASAIATLQELAPGRVRLGLGVGDSGSTNLGLRRATLRELEVAVVGLRSLLAGDSMAIQDRDFRLAYLAADHPAPGVYVAGASDRTHALSGKVADGALVAGAPDDFPISLRAIREAERAAGRPAGACRPVLWTTISVDEDRVAARQTVRPVVARKAIFEFSRLARQGLLPADSPDREPFERLQAAWDSLHHMGDRYAGMVEERWVDRFAIAGQADEVQARCRRAAEQGAVEVSAIFRSSGPGGLEEQLVRFAQGVIAPLRTAAPPSR